MIRCSAPDGGATDFLPLFVGVEHGKVFLEAQLQGPVQLGPGQAVLARVPGGRGGRVVDDFVNLMDLAPTFMEIGGTKPPEGLYGRSLLPLEPVSRG